MSLSLQDFLFQHRVKEDEVITHTTIQPKGKYNIPIEDSKRFYTLYNNYITKHKSHTILENPISNYIPVIVDIDLKKRLKDNERPRGLLYEPNDIKNISKIFIRVLKTILVDIKDEDLCCFVMERKGYIEKRNNKIYFKNGFHLHFPRIFLTKIQIEVILIKKVKKILKEESIKLPNGLEYHNVIDESIYRGRGKPWFIYNSTKSLEIPAYLCSFVVLSNGEERKDWKKFLREEPFMIRDKIEESLVDIFSIRGENKTEFYYEIKVDEQIDDDYIETNNQDIMEENKRFNRNRCEKQDEWVDELLSLLPYSYSEEYEKWKHIGWILYNIYDGTDDGFYRWDNFSQQCKEKYSFEEIKRDWSTMEKKNITMGSLKHLVKKERPEEYMELCHRFTEEYYKNSLYQCSTTHYDIAKILHLTYENVYTCASVEKNGIWYKFDRHIWRKVEDGVSLRNKISTDIVTNYESMRSDVINDEKKELERKKRNYENEMKMKKNEKQLREIYLRDLDPSRADEKIKIKEEMESIKKINDKIIELEDKVKEIEQNIESISSEYMKNGDTKEMKQNKMARVEKLSKIIGNLKTRPFKNNVMAEARDMFYNEYFIKNLDADPWLVAFENGVYDLKRNIFRDGEPNDNISKNLPISYRNDFTIDSPSVKMAIDFFLRIFPDESIRDYFLSIQSEVFLGRNKQKIFQIWTGDGDNGKSITQDIFERMLGELCVKLPTSTITGQRGQSSSACPELVRAGSGARMCIVQEPGKTDRINTGMLKELSGNDKFYARGLHKDPVDINPMFKLVMVCNKPPVIDNSQSDQATWNRTRLIPFESFFPKDESLVPLTLEEQLEKKIFQRDPNFSDKIPDMIEGVAWYLLEIYKNNKGKIIVEPKKVLEATAEYRKSNDNFKRFLDEKVEDSEEGRLSFNQLYDAFKDWYRESYPSKVIPNGPLMKEYIIKLWGLPSRRNYWRNKKIIEEIID